MRYEALSTLVDNPEAFAKQPPTEPEVFHRDPAVARALLDVAAVDAMIGGTPLPAGLVSVVSGGVRLPRSRYAFGAGSRQGLADGVSAAKVQALLAQGSTLVLDALERTSPTVGPFTRRLAFELGVPVGVNAYLTPASSQGFAHHYDTHAGLIVQTEGAKTWQLHAPVVTDPLEHQGIPLARWPQAEQERVVSGKPWLEVELQPGDALWIPRGWVHNGFATGQTSLHITFGLARMTPWWVAQQVMATLEGEASMRRELPAVNDPAQMRTAVLETIGLLQGWLARQTDPAPLGDGGAPEGNGGLLPDTVGVDEVVSRALAEYGRYGQPTHRQPVRTVLAPTLSASSRVRLHPEAVTAVLEEQAADRTADVAGVVPVERLRVHLGDAPLQVTGPSAALLASILREDLGGEHQLTDLDPTLDGGDLVRAAAPLVQAGVVEVLT